MWTSNWLPDVRTGWRAYRRAPLHSTIAAFVMALGIATTATMYALSLAVSNTVPPIPDPARIARLYVADTSLPLGRRTPDALESASLTARTIGLGTPTVVTGENARLSIDGCTDAAMPVHLSRVDAAFFEVSRVQPAMGRIWTTDDVEHSTPVVIGEALWRRACGVKAYAAGRVVRVNGTPTVLVGVMPDGFWLTNSAVEAWLPSGASATTGSRDVFLRLDDGVSVADVNDRLREEPQGLALALTDATFSRSVQSLVGLVAPAVLVLLVACANAAAILAGRAARRTRELAIKVSLGATGSRLARQAIAEAAVVAGVAGLIAAPLVWAATMGVRHELAAVAPGLARLVVIDGRVAVAAFAAAALAALLTGVLPAIRASRAHAGPLLSRSPRRAIVRRGHYAVTDLLVIVQVALGVVLIVVTALFTGVFDAIASRPSGQNPDGVVAAALRMSETSRADTPLMVAVVDALRSLPGVSSVALSDSLPVPGLRRSTRIATADDNAAPCLGTVRMVTPEYFELLGLSVQAGRIFDANGQNVAVASASLAALCWNRQAIGRQVVLGGSGAERVLDVIGVVDDASQSAGLSQMLPVDLYVPYASGAAESMVVLVAAPTNVAGISREAGEIVRQASGSRLILDAPATLRVLGERQLHEVRVLTGLLWSVGLVAWLLATVGLHSSIAQSLTARWRDFGIRAALGASPWSLMAATVGRDLPLLAIGAAAGILVTVAVTSIVWADAVRIGGAGLRTWLTVLGTLALSAVAASAGPAIRASRLDPISALRRDGE